MSEIDTSRTLIDDSKVTLQIVVTLPDESRGIIYNHNMFIVQSTNLIFIWTKRGGGKVNRVACTINARWLLVNDQHKWRLLIDDSKVMLQIVVSLPDESRGIIYDHNMFIVQSLISYSFKQKEGKGK